MPAYPDDTDIIPVDPAVLIGQLDNGISYFIRRNTRPGQRAQLRLAVKAGSVQEDADQLGAAHFLEHMMFNGTESFPSNELIQVLQRFGAEFGPDINAYTNFEETVYELQLATDDFAILETGFDVLAEWAYKATIDPAEVEFERGVLLEEWRLRSQRFEGRYFDGVIAQLLGETPFVDRSPLAGPEELDETTPATLRRFYETWYRPDQMAVIAVGDFNVAAVEDAITARFDPLVNPPGEPALPDTSTLPADEPAFFILADPEFPSAFVELNYPNPPFEPGPVGAQRRQLALDIGFEVLATRLGEDALRGDTPFFDPSRAANPLVRSQQSPGLAASADSGDLLSTAEALLTEIERALRHGFTQGEVDRAVDLFRSIFDQAFETDASKQDGEYANDYVEHFLGGTPIPTAEGLHDLMHRLLDEVTVNQISATFQATIGATEPFVIVVGPESAGSELPSDADLADLLSRIAGSEIGPRADDTEQLEALMERPEPADITSQDVIPELGGAVVWKLENGATVVALPTDIGRETVVFSASSLGGWSIVPDEDVAEAQLAGEIVSKSGVGMFDQVVLERFLAGQVVGVFPFIDGTFEGLAGQSSTDDLETMFQLIHLFMTQPRAEETALDTVLSEIRPFAADPLAIPDLAVLLALVDARYAGDDKFSVFPPLAGLDSFDLDRSLQVFEERFGNASDFLFAFAGDFRLGDVEALARSYIGTLPGSGTREQFEDDQPDPPAGVVQRTVAAGQGELAGVTMLFTADADNSAVTRVEVEILNLILRQRFTERVREELSATYSPFVRVQHLDRPDLIIETFIQVSADPDRLQEVSQALLTDMADLIANGPTDDQLVIAKEQLIREYELVSNEFWVQQMLFYLERPDQDPLDVIVRIDRAADVTVGDIRSLARSVLPGDHYIEIRLVPVGF